MTRDSMFKSLIVVLGLLLPASGATSETLVLGSVENDVRRQVVNFQPLAHYLENALIPWGIDDVQITVMREDQDIAAALRSGKIDLYFETPVVAAKVARDSGAVPLLRQFRLGGDTYRTLIIAPVDGPVQTMNDLVNRRIAFTERSSSSGFLVPAFLLDQAGLDLAKLRRRTRDVPEGKVGYVFTQDQNNTIYWLSRGWIDAGAISDKEFDHLNAIYPDRFQIIAESAFMPREVVLHREGLSPDLIDAITATLITMHHSDEGRAAVKAFFETDRFVAFPQGHTTFVPLFAILDRLTRIGII